MVSDAAFSVPEVTSQSRLSRKECRAAPASPVYSPALYCQVPSISSFRRDVRLCTEHVCSATRAGILLPLNQSQICQDTSVGDECQEYSANQMLLFIKHMKGRLLESLSPDKHLQPGWLQEHTQAANWAGPTTSFPHQRLSYSCISRSALTDISVTKWPVKC